MKKDLRAKAVKLRLEKELSYSDIKKELNVPKSTLSYWLREYPLSEEKIRELRKKGWTKGEASRERYRNTMRKKKEEQFSKYHEEGRKKFKKLSERSFYIAGLMLYLGEGAKRKSGLLNIANTDPAVILFFLEWIDRCLGIKKGKVKIQLHLYENMNIAKEQKFWKNTLGVKDSQFYKSSIRKLQDSSFSYKESFRHGTCSVYAFGEEKRMKVMADMKALLQKLSNK